jgi:CheY-like chemotaxis protein
MLTIMLVGFEKKPDDFIQTLQKNDDVSLVMVSSGREALDIISRKPHDLVIAAASLRDMDGLQFARDLVACSPMTNCAVSSDMPPDAFHEASEGLGLLAQLPVLPGPADAAAMLEKAEALKTAFTPMENRNTGRTF